MITIVPIPFSVLVTCNIRPFEKIAVIINTKNAGTTVPIIYASGFFLQSLIPIRNAKGSTKARSIAWGTIVVL